MLLVRSFLLLSLLTCEKINIDSLEKLDQIPSASGIESYHENYYIISDDSPFLFLINEKGEIIEKISLFPSLPTIDGRIDKSIKPDLEAICTLPDGKLLLLGSGSIPEKRDIAVVFDPKTGTFKTIQTESLYSEFRKVLSEILNIEAAAIKGADLFLFHRSFSGENISFKLSIIEFLKYLNKNTLPSFITYSVSDTTLSPILGISGATLEESGDFVLTFTEEITTDPVKDGKVNGSFIGLWNPETGPCKSVIQYPFKKSQLKVEGVQITRKDKNEFYFLSVTDNDNGNSFLVKGRFTIR